MDTTRTRLTSGPPPGTDPAALRLITAAVLAGMMVTAALAVIHVPARQAPEGMPPAGAAPAEAAPAAGPAGAGLHLLEQAAQASRSVAYRGLEVLSWTGPGGDGSSVVSVWHPSGGQTLTQPVREDPSWQGRPQLSVPWGSAGGGERAAADGVLTISPRRVTLLAANYRIGSPGHGEVLGRPAHLVPVRRGDGSLAARFWLDSTTMLPLRRQMFDPAGRLVSELVFSQLRLGPGPVTAPRPAPQPTGTMLMAGQLAGLRASGWPLPGPLPGHLTLLDARESATAAGPVVDLDYSDGLSVVSIFLQRGHLPSTMAGWSRVALAGHRVYADDPGDLSVAWSARGFVYTVIATAPQQLIGQVVAALPHESGPGILDRIVRGLHRLFGG